MLYFKKFFNFLVIGLTGAFIFSVSSRAADPIHFTGVNPTLTLCHYTGRITIDGVNAVNNEDEVGVFVSNDEGGEILVGAYVIGTNTPDYYMVNVYGDDFMTDEKDGCSPYDELIFKVWDKSKGMEYTVSPSDMSYESEQGFSRPDIPPIWYPLSIYGLLNFDIQTGTTPSDKIVEKAIIVAGKKPSYDPLWESTKICANYAYRALRFQGYTKENIYYLCPDDIDADGDGSLNDVDKQATYDNLSYAINTWTKTPDNTADELLIYMVDHGGDKSFRLNAGETVSAGDLDKWLDGLQETMSGKVIFIYDACQSGTFISPMLPQDEKERIIITSASDESALFMKQGRHSFSYQFWATVFEGASLREAFYFGTDMMADVQTPKLDANGNGIPNEENDYRLVREIVIGKGYVSGTDAPEIENAWAEKQILSGETANTLFAGPIIDTSDIEKVWAVITHSCYTPESPDIPITDLPVVALEDPDKDGIYEGVCDKFFFSGDYNIAIYAENVKEAYSSPKNITVTQNNGTPCLQKGDINKDGTVNLADAITALKIMVITDMSLPPDYTVSGADVNGDGKIGLEDAVYVIRMAGSLF